MKIPKLIIFTGNIGCGKSFLASKFAKKGYVVVNNDAITTMVQGGEYALYDPAKKPIYKIIETTTIAEALRAGFSVVVDRTNMSVSDRKRYIDIGKACNVDIHSYDWGHGGQEPLNRRLLSPNGIPRATWFNVHMAMQKAYLAPELKEGFDTINDATKAFKFYAFDFDGTIVENDFPGIGKIRGEMVDKINTVWKGLNNVIIIWTCRGGDSMNVMKEFLIAEGIPFDFINKNPIVNFGSSKIFAHEYYDDRNRLIDDC